VKTIHIFLVMLFSVGMGLGQLLLKYAANRQSTTSEENLGLRLLSLAFDWPFILGAATYLFLLVYWVWLLTFLPLSRAYPFTLLSLLVAAIGSAVLFQEAMTPRFIMGLSVIGIGLLILGSE
jgi:hypothetical protein